MTIKPKTSIKIRTSPKIKECELSNHVEIRTTNSGLDKIGNFQRLWLWSKLTKFYARI